MSESAYNDSLQNVQTTIGSTAHSDNYSVPDSSLVWTYGLLLITGINLCSLFGIALNPLSKRKWYRELLLFMVALAVGVLVGSSLLFLLSGALGISELEWHQRKEYIGKITILLTSVFLFFNFEQILKLILAVIVEKRKGKTAMKNNVGEVPLDFVSGNNNNNDNNNNVTGSCEDESHSMRRRQKIASNNNNNSNNDDSNNLENLPVSSVSHHHQHTHVLQTASETLDISATDISSCMNQNHPGSTSQLVAVVSTDNLTLESDIGSTQRQQQLNQEKPNQKDSYCSKLVSSLANVQPVAWMVIFGDGIHNFVDGLSIGAGMAHSLPDGLSIAIAVLAEELPHELGDFAILLRAGLSVRHALLLNFMSACFCYLGFVIGVLVGESPTANTVIFAFAAGLFLYISLTDLLPELSPEAISSDSSDGDIGGESSSNKHGHSHLPPASHQSGTKQRLKHLGIANLGMIIGYSMMVLLAFYSEDIIVVTNSDSNGQIPPGPSTFAP